ncbi:MAG TPA: zinc dependent phospholipase C family protein [Tissierellaceae bacterium]|nr:zinc dependent phospholipase C family protein [Tissierellaceae bacterium]
MKKELFQILADSHKIIVTNIYDKVFEDYGLKLDKNKLLWGSIAPDILPKYRLFIRHYKDESLDYIAKEIIKIIFISRYLEFNNILDPISIKVLSRRIGIVSHYLSDYVCLPHAKRWTFKDSMVKHLKYESQLDDFTKTFDFKDNVIDTNDINIYEDESTDLKSKIKNYINSVVEEYSFKIGFDNDLNFALSINIKITNFILDTIADYSEELYSQLVFEI